MPLFCQITVANSKSKKIKIAILLFLNADPSNEFALFTVKMTILFVSICKKDGSVIVARSFYDISKSRIEGLIGSLPKLISKTQQSTFVETEQVRYIFKPLDHFGFLVIVTTKNSNIIQDIDTLHACSAAIAELCPSSTESSQAASILDSPYVKKKFEILFIFDELVHQGLKQSITGSQLSKILAMESQDEIIEEAIQKRKEKEAKELTKLKIKQIEMQKKEAAKKEKQMGHSYIPASINIETTIQKSTDTHVGNERFFCSESQIPSAYSTLPAGKGLVLGKSSKKSNLGLLQEETKYSMPSVDTEEAKVVQSSSAIVITQHSTQLKPISISIEETFSASLNREGQLENLDIKGNLSLCVVNPEFAHISLCLSKVPLANANVQWKTHPNINKEKFNSQHILCMKDQSKPFPINQNLGLLKWRLASNSHFDDLYLPILINCWPSQKSPTEIEVSMEFECKNTQFFPLKDVIFRIPCSESFQVSAVDGEFEYNSSYGCLEWSIAIINENFSTGSLSFTAKGVSISDVFPIQASFKMDNSILGIDLDTVVLSENNAEVVDEFEKHFTFKTENFVIQ